jgi:dihydroorotate dehydrogenase (NAD+) catalytic subunit
VALRFAGVDTLIAYRLNRSFAWNAAHPPPLPPRPRKLPATPARLFDRTVECPVGIAAGPLPNTKWIQAYARLGYGLLTYKTVRTVEAAALPAPNVAFCRLGDPALVEPTPRRLDPETVTWAISLGQPSAEPAEWRADVAKARARLAPTQLLIVSVAGTPLPGGDGEQLARDYAQAARWAAEAGADVIEAHLASPAAGPEHPQMVFEDQALALHVVDQIRRAVGTRPVVAKLGATRSPRVLHDLATALARRVDGFVLVDGLQRRVVKPDGAPAFPGAEREIASIGGAAVWDHCRVQIHELIAWRKAGAWDRAILGVGGITTVARAREELAAGVQAALIGTAALVDPLLAARFRRGAAR